MMFGASPIAVQRILRHSDIRTTTDVYSHLAPDYLRAEINSSPSAQNPTRKRSDLLHRYFRAKEWGLQRFCSPPNPRTMSATYFGRGERI